MRRLNSEEQYLKGKTIKFMKAFTFVVDFQVELFSEEIHHILECLSERHPGRIQIDILKIKNYRWSAFFNQVKRIKGSITEFNITEKCTQILTKLQTFDKPLPKYCLMVLKAKILQNFMSEMLSFSFFRQTGSEPNLIKVLAFIEL